MELPIQFDDPWALWLLWLVPLVVWIGWKHLTGMGPLRRGLVCGMRALVVLMLALTLAGPKWLERSEALSVVLLMDRSRSISPQLELAAMQYVRDAIDAADDRRPIDRVAVINIGAEARVEAMPDRTTVIDLGTPVINLDATNLAQGMRLGMAIAPRDTATRFVLVSDGNENVDNVMSVADIARANGIPVDVLRLEYDYGQEVLFDRIAAPAQAREGQNVGLRLILRAQRSATGRITLAQNGEPIDLDPDGDLLSRTVELVEGVNVIPLTITLDRMGPQRFHAVFEPDDPSMDQIASNNQADAVVMVSGEGRILVVQDAPEETSSLLEVLAEADLDFEVRSPVEVTDEVLALAAYDSIILANVPAHALSVRAHEALRQYVHDIGGGLIVVGGPDSLGAGGWIDTPLEKALPVKLDPPDKKQMPRGALVCIMHSSEIPQGNYWGEQCAIAAINALSRLDYAGVIDFGVGGVVWEYPLQIVGDKSAAISAIKKMQMGDMPDFAPAMQMALNDLMAVNAGQKHVVIISDGDPQRPPAALLQDFINARITISTVVAGGHGVASDAQTMQWIAETTGGRYYNPKTPGQMPEIFIKEAVVVRRSLIVEGDTYALSHRPTIRPGPFSNRWVELPPVQGYVLTAPRPGFDPEVVTNLGDPMMAHWQYGLGKSIVFTSDATTRWAPSWTTWAGFRAFWEQAIRWTMKPAAPRNLLVTTQLEGQRAIIEAEALTGEGSYANFGRMQALVIAPDLKTETVTLQQTGPGRWRGEFTADRPGSWVVNLSREDADGTVATVQAGVSIPYSQEYRAIRDNSALMNELAQRTGGRVLPSDPAQAAVFDRTGLEVPRSLSDLWTLMAVLTAALFLMDVAVRRLAIDPIAVRETLRKLAGGRAQAAGQAMGRLKEVRGQAQARMARPGAAEGEPPADVAARRFEATPGQRPAIDLDAEVAADAGHRASDVRPAAGDRAKPEDESPTGDEGSYTSRLLDAKRRARKQGPEDQP